MSDKKNQRFKKGEDRDRDKVCGAKKGNGQICQNMHIFANGRCKFHGGLTKGRVNGSGILQTITKDTFTDEEKEFLKNTDISNIEQQLLSEIEIITIRLNRMLKKIQIFKEREWINNEKKDSVGQTGQQIITNSEVTSISNEMLIQKIESDITKVQNQKMKLLNSLAAYRSTLTQNNNIDVSIFVNAVKGENNIWEADENDDTEDGDED